MRRGLIIAVSMALTTTLTAQTIEHVATDAWLITRMADRYHVSPRPLDKEMSAAIFSQLLDGLDGDRLIFTADDIRQLSAYRLTLDEEILNRRTTFLAFLAGLYKERLTRTDSLIDSITARPFDFTLHETLAVTEDTSWASSR
jgi:carboxyl-terminal processing protease